MSREAKVLGGLTLDQLAQLDVGSLLALRRQESPSAIAMVAHMADGGTHDISWSDITTKAKTFSAALRLMGIEPGGRVGLLCDPGLEAAIAVLGCQIAGCVTVGLHTTASDEQVKAIIVHARPAFIMTDDPERLRRAFGGHLPEYVVGLCTVAGAVDVSDNATTWEAFLAKAAGSVDVLSEMQPTVSSSDAVAAVFYTSGTTGTPKGVMVTWRGLVLSLCGMFGRDALSDVPVAGDRTIHDISMATPTGYWFGLIYPLIYGCTAHIAAPTQDAVALRRLARPTVYYGRPAIWLETGREILDRSGRSALRRAGFGLLMRLGKALLARQSKGAAAPLLKAAHDRLRSLVVGTELHAAGLDCVRYAFCGGAPLPAEVVDQWFCWGITIRTFYGMTECSGVATVVSDAIPRQGTVGKPGLFADIRLAPDGEILIGGPILFAGYLDQPDLTRQAIDDDGYLRTGDLGERLDDGSLVMLDRKSNVVQLNDGTAVISFRIEAVLRSSPFVAFAMIIGNGREHLCALIEMNAARVAQAIGRPADAAALSADRAAIDLFAVHLKTCNARNAETGLPPVRDFFLIPARLTPADPDVMTATGKVRRANLEKRYARQIDDMYRQAPGAAQKTISLSAMERP